MGARKQHKGCGNFHVRERSPRVGGGCVWKDLLCQLPLSCFTIELIGSGSYFDSGAREDNVCVGTASTFMLETVEEVVVGVVGRTYCVSCPCLASPPS